MTLPSLLAAARAEKSTKYCTKCSTERPKTDFFKDRTRVDNLTSLCRFCKNEYGKKLESRKQEHVRALKLKNFYVAKAKFPEKEKARNALRNAVKRGQITRLPCEKCGVEKSQAHHHDYSKPLDVNWLCVRHHSEHHRNLRLAAEEERITKQ